jgi:hypothetical protein
MRPSGQNGGRVVPGADHGPAGIGSNKAWWIDG